MHSWLEKTLVMQKLSCHTVRKQEDRKTSFSPGFRSWLVTMCLHDAAHDSARANGNAQLGQKKQDWMNSIYSIWMERKRMRPVFTNCETSQCKNHISTTAIISPPRRPWHCCEGRRLRLRGLSKASLRSFLSKLCFVDQNKRILRPLWKFYSNSTVVL